MATIRRWGGGLRIISPVTAGALTRTARTTRELLGLLAYARTEERLDVAAIRDICAELLDSTLDGEVR